MSLAIKDLLLAYKARLRAPQSSVLREVVKAYSLSGIEIDMKDVDYSPASKIVIIKALGPKKTEMMLRKNAVLRDVKTMLRDADAPTDII